MAASPSLGQFIADRRQDLGLTQEQLAERIGEHVRQSDVSRLERNRITLPRRERLEQLAAALEVSLGDLLARTGWLTAGDELETALDGAVSGAGAAMPPAPGEIRDLIRAVEDARRTIATALDSLASADAALDRTLHTLQGQGERARTHPPAGVITRWETAQIHQA
jgi:transcriptional regulator with XRE-family HTH domain